MIDGMDRCNRAAVDHDLSSVRHVSKFASKSSPSFSASSKLTLRIMLCAPDL